MALKATHSGHCQLCGHFQKLPGNKLSLHGYTVEWGFFSGTCPGSRDEPYELSCDAIKARIPGVEAELVGARARVTAIMAQREVVFFHEYIPATFARGQRSSRYEWRELTLGSISFTASASTPGAVYATASMISTHGNNRRQSTNSVFGDNEAQAIEALIVEQNKERARALLDYIKQVEGYLAWCVRRVADWKLSPLTPVEPEAPKSSELIKAGTIVKIYGAERTIIRTEYRVARGCGPHLNGNSMLHAVWLANDGKTELACPVRLIRRASIVKAAA